MYRLVMLKPTFLQKVNNENLQISGDKLTAEMTVSRFIAILSYNKILLVKIPDNKSFP